MNKLHVIKILYIQPKTTIRYNEWQMRFRDRHCHQTLTIGSRVKTANIPRGETFTNAVRSSRRDTDIAHCIQHVTNIADSILTGDVYAHFITTIQQLIQIKQSPHPHIIANAFNKQFTNTNNYNNTHHNTNPYKREINTS